MEIISHCNFESLGLHSSLVAAVESQGYSTPTPIQMQAIPAVLQGLDVMGAAQTGTGKTASFALPLLHRLLPFANTSVSPAKHPVRALILTPTRELADQVADNIARYSSQTNLRHTVIYGGVDMEPQIMALRQGVEIVVATPGRLLDHLTQKTIQLQSVQMLVLDEADRMLDMGFLPDLQRIVEVLPAARQSLLFSATFSKEIKRLAQDFLRDPVVIEVARQNSLAETITQTVFHVPSGLDKQLVLKYLLDEQQVKQVIVFCNTKQGASKLARFLQKSDISADAIHGDKTQQERTKVLEQFKAGQVAVLIATDVAARGLDIADLPYVINFDLPFTPEDYVHRIGRTGRAGRAGAAWSFCAQEDVKSLQAIERLVKTTFVRETLPEALLMVDHAAPKLGRYGSREDAGDSRGRMSDRKDRGVRLPARGRYDPLFDRPYVPSQTAAKIDAQASLPRAKIKQSILPALVKGFGRQ